jgi:DNA adenine methylase
MFFTACYNQPFVMILRRIGNKKQIANEIQKHFCEHKYYVEPFFGAGGMFFNKPKAKYNVVNDIDSDVYNLFNVVTNRKQELKDSLYMMPIHTDLLNYWLKNTEKDEMKKALRFLFLSNFVLNGRGGSIRHMVSGGAGGVKDFKDNFDINIENIFKMLYDVNFTNWDFRKFINTLSFQKDGRNDEAKTLIYADPPYLGTGDNYSHSFTENDCIELLDCLQNRGCNFAYSEFDNEFILNQAKERRLNVIYIGERTNLKNKRTEILVTNYQKAPTLF